jgi:transcriptional regulator with GAF, ATPase, and Fis domain
VATSTRPGTTATAPVDAWLEVVGAPDAVVAAVARGLAAMDVNLRPRRGNGTSPAHFGIVAFGGPPTRASDLIREITDAGTERVLALSTTPGLGGDETWALMDAGASDVVTWLDHADAARHVGERLRRWRTIDDLLVRRHVQEALVGDSRIWRSVLRDVVEVARFTHASVLVTGESGTGKEQVARLIHELDSRPGKKELVVLDCSTVVPSLSGSEFFGHEKGAFTGAAAARAGAFELADGGTLFLDEVGELPVTLQAELLRVIQEGTFKRVGSNMWRRSTFRLVCATNRDLEVERAAGTFRHDFFYRIAECTLRLPSLRDRPDDIVPLFEHFFRQVHPDRQPPDLEDAVRHLLVSRGYPGNVRDLRSLVLRIAHRHLGDHYVTVGDVPEEDRPGADRSPSAGPWPDPAFEDSIRRALALGARLEDIASAVTQTVARLALEASEREALTRG